MVGRRRHDCDRCLDYRRACAGCEVDGIHYLCWQLAGLGRLSPKGRLIIP